MRGRFEREMQEDRSRDQPSRFPEASIAEVAQDLATDLKLAFQEELARQRDVHPRLSSHLDEERFRKRIDVPDEECSVEVYDRPGDVARYLAELGMWDVAADVPRGSAVLVMRFPPQFHFPKGLKGAPIPLAKKELSDRWWEVRRRVRRRAGVDIERVMPAFEHDDRPLSGYYYVWLVTPEGRMSPALERRRAAWKEAREDEFARRRYLANPFQRAAE